MEKQELYHFHKVGEHDEAWKVNNTIIAKANFNTPTFKRFQNFTTCIELDDSQKANLHDYVVYLIRNNIYNFEILGKLLNESFNVSFRANEFKRENALENYRLKHFNDYPSRLHSIYLTDERGIKTWKNKFGSSNLVLFRVEASGNIFKTSEYLIPDELLSYKDVYDKAFNYWNPDFKKIDDDSNEYLVQGKVKILEKITKF